MKINFTEVVLLASGAYSVYSGRKGVYDKSGTKSKGWEMAKVVLGAGLIAGSVGNFFDRLEASRLEALKLSFDATKCDVAQLDRILEEREYTNTLAPLFRVLKDRIGVTCDNFLPWKNSFYPEDTADIAGITPADLNQSVMWGIDPWERPYIAIRHTCDKVTKGAMVFFHRSPAGVVVNVGHHAMNSCMPQQNTFVYQKGFFERDFSWLTDLLSKGLASWKKWDGQVTAYLA